MKFFFMGEEPERLLGKRGQYEWNLHQARLQLVRNQGGVVGLIEAQRLLQGMFHIEAFRPQQWEIVQCLMAREEDVLVIQPTGMGKSLPFQVAQLLDGGGMTLVLCPLLSLIEDQVSKLRALGVPTVKLTGSQHAPSREKAFKEIEGDKVRFIYTTPEFLLSRMADLCVRLSKLRRIVLDEVHCVTAWAEFRRAYGRMAGLRTFGVPFVLLTATLPQANGERGRVLESLGIPLDKVRVFECPMRQDNIRYSVFQSPTSLFGSEALQHLLELLSRTAFRGTGLIWVSSRRETELLAQTLLLQGFPAAAYHAGLGAKARKERQRAWMKNEGFPRVLVCTMAFGLGVSNSACGWSIHYGPPRSMVQYVQESGRAGRAGQMCESVIMFRNEFQTMIPRALTDLKREELQAMRAYCMEVTQCRVGMLLDAFGRIGSDGSFVSCMAPRSPSVCDNCFQQAPFFG